MGSWFDTEVYQRRQHTPWARMNLLAFMHEMAYNEQQYTEGGTKLETPRPGSVTLTVTYRHDVSSRFWYEIAWFDEEDGRYCSACSQELDLCLWRAAQFVLRDREKAALAEAKRRTPEVIGRPVRTSDGVQAGEIAGLLYDPTMQKNLAAVRLVEDGPHGKVDSVGYFVEDELKEPATNP